MSRPDVYIREIALWEVAYFQEYLWIVLENGPALFSENGLCQAIRYAASRYNPYLGYDILRHLLPREVYDEGIEEAGVFGPIRQTFAMMLVELAPEELFAMLNQRDENGRFNS